MKRIAFLAIAWLCAILGFIGVIVPVLPTTPFLLAATFFFARSSTRLHKALTNTRIYQVYVEPFKAAGGMTLAAKIRALVLCYAVMGISAFLVQKVWAWVILSLCALLMAYIILVRVPSVSTEAFRAARLKVVQQGNDS